MGKFFRLKAGTHTQGEGLDTKVFRSNDSQALESCGNIVESDEDLALQEPTRWEEYRGEITEQMKKGVRGFGGISTGSRSLRSLIAGEPPPPGPSDSTSIAEAADLTASMKLSAEEMEKHAEALTERAEALKQRAQEARQAEQQNTQQRKEFVASHRHEDEEDDDEVATKTTRANPSASAATTTPRQPVQSEKDYHASIDRMSLEDLKTHAKEKKVDLKGATKREDIVKILKTGK